MMFPGISRAHELELQRARMAEREERVADETLAESLAYRSAALAEDYREALAVAQAAEMTRQQRLEQAELQRSAERQAQAEDYRDRLLQSGQGRWRTVAEVLAAARGMPG